MADEIVAKYKVDVAEASKNLTDLANAAKRTEDAIKKSGQSAADGFLKGSGGEKAFELAMKSSGTTIAGLNEKLRQLREILANDAKIGTDAFKQITKAIKDTEAEIDKANGKLKETGKQGTSLIGTFKNMAAAIGIAFGVQQIISFGKEAVQLAAKAEGVKRAFDRIGDASLLDGLRAATRGTVTDLVLMQNAVKADNFKIPLNQLATLFQFAQTRARATGESVDYLVDSLILGIGRKSIPILDNLGISAVELKEKLGDTAKSAATIGDVAAAVGKIATESLQKTGIEADTTADKLAQLETKWTNLKTTMGSGIIGFVTFVASELRIIEQDSQAVADAMAKIANASSAALLKQIEIQKAAVESAREVFSEASSNKLTKQGYEEVYNAAKINLNIQKDILNALEEKRKALEKEGKAYKNLEQAAMALGTLDEFTIENIEREIQKLRELDAARGEQIKNVFYYTEAIKDLNEKINAEGTAIADIMPLIRERAEMQKELTRLTAEETTGINRLNAEMAALKKELESAEVGGQGFFEVLDKIAAKQNELDFANALVAPLRDANVVLAELAERESADFAKAQEEKLAILREYAALVLDIQNELALTSNDLLDIETQAVISEAQKRREFVSQSAEAGAIDAAELSQALLDIDAAEKAGLLTAQEAHNERVFALNKELADKNAALKQAELDNEAKTQQQTVELIQAGLSTIGSMYNSMVQFAENAAASELQILQKKYEEGQISAEEFEHEQIRIQRESAQRAKDAATFNAIMGAAQAVISALSSPGVPFPVALAFSLLAAAQAAVQVAAIQNTPLPQYEEGGWVDYTTGAIKGRKHKQGGVKIEAEGGEFITKASQAMKHKDLLTAINKGIGDKYIMDNYVAPMMNASVLGSFDRIGDSAMLNGLTAKLSDHNLVRAIDRDREATVYGFNMLKAELAKTNRRNIRSQW